MSIVQLFAQHAATGPSPWRAEFLREQQVLPGLCGLPRVIRAFVGVRP